MAIKKVTDSIVDEHDGAIAFGTRDAYYVKTLSGESRDSECWPVGPLVFVAKWLPCPWPFFMRPRQFSPSSLTRLIIRLVSQGLSLQHARSFDLCLKG
jgi:hypothetical protein